MLGDISCHQISFITLLFNTKLSLAGEKVKVMMVLEALFLCPLTHFSKEPPLTIGL